MVLGVVWFWLGRLVVVVVLWWVVWWCCGGCGGFVEGEKVVGGEMVVLERWWVGSLAGEPLDGEPLAGELVACVLGRQEVWEIR